MQRQGSWFLKTAPILYVFYSAPDGPSAQRLCCCAFSFQGCRPDCYQQHGTNLGPVCPHKQPVWAGSSPHIFALCLLESFSCFYSTTYFSLMHTLLLTSQIPYRWLLFWLINHCICQSICVSPVFQSQSQAVTCNTSRSGGFFRCYSMSKLF